MFKVFHLSNHSLYRHSPFTHYTVTHSFLRVVSTAQTTASQLAQERRISAKQRQRVHTSPNMPHLPPIKTKGFSEPTISKNHLIRRSSDQKRQFVDFIDSPGKNLSSSERIKACLSSECQSPLLKEDDIVTENNKISISLSKSRGRECREVIKRNSVESREVKKGNSNNRTPQRRKSVQNGK